MAENARIVLAALVAESALAVAKFGAFLLTASPALLAEALHSTADGVTNLLLLFGIRHSETPPDVDHPFGYGRAQFFYSFVVSLLLFTVAGFASVHSGVTALREGSSGRLPSDLAGRVDPALPVDPVVVAVGVLAVAVAVEALALREAVRELRRQMAAFGWGSYREALATTSDTVTQVTLFDEAVGVTGAVLALCGVAASHVTGDPRYDAAAAVLVGLIMMGFAAALAVRSKRLLIGAGLPADTQLDLAAAMTEAEGIEAVDYLRTTYVGPGAVLVAADVAIADDLDAEAVTDAVAAAERRCLDADRRVQAVYVEPSR